MEAFKEKASMLESPADLDRLDHLLSALPLEAEAMLLSELDGFLAGLLILPGVVAEAEWLPHVWNHFPLEGSETATAAEIGKIARLRKTEIALGFRAAGAAYEPVFDFDLDGSLMWELWFEGYERAIGLQEYIYDTLIADGGENVREAVTGLAFASLVAHREWDSLGTKLTSKELHARLPEAIPRHVETLYRHRHGLAGHPFVEPPSREMAPLRAAKPGRNAPCPCGSGQKFKKCCGR